MRFVIGCGGTGGHIFPALAVAEFLNDKGHEILFVGNRDGMEASIVAAEGYAFAPIKAQKLLRKLSPQMLTFPYYLVTSTIACVRAIKRFRPNAVFCTGGFVSGPVAAAAVLTRVPLFFHESNSLPGITTRAFARFTKTTFISFSASGRYLRNARLVEVGVPLMQKVLHPCEYDLTELGLDPAKPVILVSGGSQGAAAINTAVDEAMPEISQMGFAVIWQAGKAGFPSLNDKYQDREDLHLFDFSTRLPQFYKGAALAITRAGAMTLAELEENRLPAILIPLPTAAENHQYHNAMEQQRKGFAIVLEQKNLNKTSLVDAIRELYKNRENYRKELGRLHPNSAAADIGTHIISSLEKGR